MLCLAAAGVGAFVGSGGWAAPSVSAAAPTAVTPGSIETSFAPVVEKALPAVVNISSSKATKVSALGMPQMDPFFRQFFGEEFGGREFGRRNRGTAQRTGGAQPGDKRDRQ